MQALLLGVNIDHVATLRQARHTNYPDPLRAARIAADHGADSITLHLREDRRHIQEHDLYRIMEWGGLPVNLELAITDAMLTIAEQTRPAYCCFVPERRQELTTEGGLDVLADPSRVTDACNRMREAGIQVSLFIDADPAQIDAAAGTGAPVIEIHTGVYAEARDQETMMQEIQRIDAGLQYARSLGLIVNAGHGLNYDNVRPVAALAGLHELNIGHAIVAESVFTGLGNAVETMRRLMNEARQD